MNLEEPLPSDCCGNGCSPCVFDIYRQRLQGSPSTAHDSSKGQVRTDLLSETRFKPFRLLKKNQIAESVFEFRFQPVEQISESREEEEISGILPYSAGQHLFLRCGVKEQYETELTNGVSSDLKIINKHDNSSDLKNINKHDNSSEKQIVIRAYTPTTIASEEKNCCFNIFVKIYERGIASEYFKNSSVGDIFYWRGPYGSYQYKPNSASHILMLCIGTGLAPMISVINSILNNESDETIIHLKCGFKNINHVILRNKLKEMTHFWNFTIEYYFSESAELNGIQFGEEIKMNKLDKCSVEDYIRNKSFKELFILICGTKQFTSEMKGFISELKNVNTIVHVF